MSSARHEELEEEEEEEEEKVWRSAWLRGCGRSGGSWSEVTWIGRDVLAWCSGLHLVFLDVPSNKLRLPRLANDAIASGASCLAGHLRHKVFAFADKNIKPRIYVYAYPSMAQLSICHKGTSFQYLAIVFAGDLLISLGSMIGFRLSIWLWRTGEKIGSVHTPIHDAEGYGQALRVNYSTPLFIAQIGNKSGRLVTWEATICATAVLLGKSEVALPKGALAKDAAWCPDSQDVLAIADRDGHVYLCDSVGNNLRRIVLSQRCATCTDLEPAAISWYRGGIILRTTFCQIRYYRRDAADRWRKLWLAKLATHPCALVSHPYRHDRVFFATTEGHVVRMNFSADLSQVPALDEKQFIGGRYRFVDFISPWDDCVAAMDDSEELSIIRADVGAEVAKVALKLQGRVTSMLSHPEYPLVVVCSGNGEVVFVSVIDCRSPKVLGRYWMQVDALDLIKFSTSGRFSAVCQKSTGSCYLFDVSCAKAISILSHLDVAAKVADVMLFDTPEGLSFCALQSVPTISKFGYKLSLHLLPAGASAFSDTSRVCCFSNFYQQLHCVPNEPIAFVGAPYLTKKLTFFRTSDWKSLNLYDVAFSGHYARQVAVTVRQNWLVTSSIDGSVIIKHLSAKKSKSVHVVTHHWSDSGVLKALINSAGNLVVALGADGSLVALRYRESAVRPAADDRYRRFSEFGYEPTATEHAKKLSPAVAEALSRPIVGFADAEDSRDAPWTAWEERRKIEEQTRLFASEREAISRDLAALRGRVYDLLDRNETGAESKRLPISAFALDKLCRERQIKGAKDEREEVVRELELGVSERERVAGWIKNQFWDCQDVLARSVFGVFEDVEVTNYALCKETRTAESAAFEFARFARDIATELTSEDDVYPWDAYTVDELKLEFEKQSRVKQTSLKRAIDKIFDEEEEPEDGESEPKHSRHLYEGMTTHRFIEPCAPYYSQFKVYAFSQFVYDNYNVIRDTARLRLYFNKHFSDVQSIKEREMNLARERVDRVLFIVSELEYMFSEHISTKLTYPEWHMKERPESIIEVSDKELRTRPYITASYQDILDKQAAEEERARLARLADDFRDRALQTMMDGVLEVRWEDIIKREPEKPDCLLAGKPVAEYTDEDNIAIKKFEQELNHLAAQRQKYRKILQTDFAKVNNMLRESIEKFNSRLQEFHLLKIKVESAIQQLNLRYVRHFAKHVHRLNELKEVDNAKSKMQQKYEELAMVEEEMQVVKNVKQEQLVNYENLLSKDKLMEKKLQNEFPTLGKNASGALFSLYKKRPRIALKNTSADEGMDLGQSIKLMEKLPYLTSESLDYLRQLDNLDARPATLPQSVEDSHWNNLVALRRLKIEHELKLRAASLNLEAAAKSLANLSRKQSELGASIESASEQLRRSRTERLESDLNCELQLVLKMGQVEDEPLRGSLAQDLRRAVLVPQRDLIQVNEAIAASGRRKIRAIERCLELGRAVGLEEWAHRCWRTRLEHASVMLYYVRMASVTREIREYLKRRRTGQADDKTALRLQSEVDLKRANLEKLVREWEGKLNSAGEEVLRIEKRNKTLDEKIIKLNVKRCDLELKKNYEAEALHTEFRDTVVKIFAERSAVVRKLLQNYEQIAKMRAEMKSMICRKGQVQEFNVE